MNRDNHPSPASAPDDQGGVHQHRPSPSVTFAAKVVDVGSGEMLPSVLDDTPLQGPSTHFGVESPAAAGYMDSEEAVIRLGTGVSRAGGSSRASSQGTSRPATALLGYEGEVESSAGDSTCDYQDGEFEKEEEEFVGVEGGGMRVLEEELRVVEEEEEEDVSFHDVGSKNVDVSSVWEDEMRVVEEEGEEREEREEGEEGEERDVLSEGEDAIGSHDDSVKFGSAGASESAVSLDVSSALKSMRAKLK